jgi:hypothetical protein
MPFLQKPICFSGLGVSLNYVVLFAFATLTASLASTANAQFRTPEVAIKYRQSVMIVQGRAFVDRLARWSMVVRRMTPGRLRKTSKLS